jgi:hypothetical protein
MEPGLFSSKTVWFASVAGEVTEVAVDHGQDDAYSTVAATSTQPRATRPAGFIRQTSSPRQNASFLRLWVSLDELGADCVVARLRMTRCDR